MFGHKILVSILIAAALRKVMSGNVLVACKPTEAFHTKRTIFAYVLTFCFNFYV